MNNTTAREIIIDNFIAINNDLKKLAPLEDMAKEYSIRVDTFARRIRECYPMEYKAYLTRNILNKRKKGIYEVYNVKKNIEDVYTFLYFQNLLLIDYRNKESVSLEDFCKYVLTIKDEFNDSNIEGEIMQLLKREEALDENTVSKNNQHKHKKEKSKLKKSIKKEQEILGDTTEICNVPKINLSIDEEITQYREILAEEEKSVSEDIQANNIILNSLFCKPIPIDHTVKYETESLKFHGINPVYDPSKSNSSITDFSVFTQWENFTRDDKKLNEMIMLEFKDKIWSDLSELSIEQLFCGYIRLNSKKLRIDEKRFFVINFDLDIEALSFEKLDSLGGFFNYDLIGVKRGAWVKLHRYYDKKLYDLNAIFDITMEHIKAEMNRGEDNLGVISKHFNLRF